MDRPPFAIEERESGAMSRETIRTEDVPWCSLCGNVNRRILYTGLKDRLFGAPGEWTLKECCHCSLVFLDPRPIPEDIGKAYEDYYTHHHDRAAPLIRSSILWVAFKRSIHVLDSITKHVFSIAKERNQLQGMYLRERPVGRLLDVGCGQGQFLHRMQEIGWDVEGVEPDSRAAEIARSEYGIAVHIGDLHSAKYPDYYFDAVTMNHVIEHVYDPVALLRECRRILKLGGVVVVVTPNIRGWGHRNFTSNWRDLDAPRHLQLFSPRTLAKSAKRAGYNTIQTCTTPANAEVIFFGSLDIWALGKHDMSSRPSIGRTLCVQALQYWETILSKFYPEAGEEVILQARNE